ncbi:gephyrin-like molybdotransferase receptor GlpR [Nocardia neocaledoniensis]|uniref:divisome protein SepX/GlpR n=1 Tax=Nocardia neocaledoniensis TaxID=236511 RepID=UPI0024543114|nr:gephyrin-like molybdotransferase receptor GlpR [Nocardia neocaledoniensis]
MPNSILWIGLVVLWVFVLFPILADRHPRIRRTTDAALATRVLHRGGAERRIRIRAAGGHDSDPDYRPRVLTKRPHRTDSEDRMTTSADEPVTEADDELLTPATELEAASEADRDDAEDRDEERSTAADSAAEETEGTATEPDSSDEEEPADPTVAARIPPAPPARLEDVPAPEGDADDEDFVPNRRGRGGYDPEADAIARAARYSFRQRAVLGLIIATILFAAFGLLLNSMFWWACGLSTAVLVGYLAYLRKQVHVEEEIRRRRAARLTRGKRREETATPEAATTRRTMDRDTARALRRRSSLLDTDDEDPMFEHLETFDPATARALRTRVEDLGRAVGE